MFLFIFFYFFGWPGVERTQLGSHDLINMKIIALNEAGVLVGRPRIGVRTSHTLKMNTKEK